MGASHRVNGIIIQPLVYTVKRPETTPQILTKKKCSVTPIPLEVPEYNAGIRVGPPVMKPQDLDLQNMQDFAMQKNLVWSLTRLSYTKDQSVSSWTGFNVKISNNKSIQRDTVGYLPRINAPFTQLFTKCCILAALSWIINYINLT